MMKLKSTSTCELSMSQNVTTSKIALQIMGGWESLKQAIKTYIQKDGKKALPDYISEIPKFFVAKEDESELDESTREAMKRIGQRIKEDFAVRQILRAKKYNIPNVSYDTDFFQLNDEIEQYEMLLEEAGEMGVYWDLSNYDPVALEQLIEEYKESERASRDSINRDYFDSRGVL